MSSRSHNTSVMNALQELKTAKTDLKHKAMTLVIFGRNEGGVEARAVAPLNSTSILDIAKIHNMIPPSKLNSMIGNVKNRQTKMQLELINATETALLKHAVESNDKTMIIEEVENLKKKVEEFKKTVNEFNREVNNFQQSAGVNQGDTIQDINRRISRVDTNTREALQAADTFNNAVENLVTAKKHTKARGKTKRKTNPKRKQKTQQKQIQIQKSNKNKNKKSNKNFNKRYK